MTSSADEVGMQESYYYNYYVHQQGSQEISPEDQNNSTESKDVAEWRESGVPWTTLSAMAVGALSLSCMCVKTKERAQSDQSAESDPDLVSDALSVSESSPTAGSHAADRRVEVHVHLHDAVPSESVVPTPSAPEYTPERTLRRADAGSHGATAEQALRRADGGGSAPAPPRSPAQWKPKGWTQEQRMAYQATCKHRRTTSAGSNQWQRLRTCLDCGLEVEHEQTPFSKQYYAAKSRRAA